MKFKGNIIITDPCYIMPKDGDEMIDSSKFNLSDWYNKPYNKYTEKDKKNSEAYRAEKKRLDELYPDYWRNGSIDISNRGVGLENFGFSNWIWESTLYGDWSCSAFKLKDGSVNKPISKLKNEDVESTFGNFCADAGLVGVFLLNEVLAFNPEFDYHKERPWTTALIEDFDGEIEYIVENGEAYIRGTGSHNFITLQTGF